MNFVVLTSKKTKQNKTHKALLWVIALHFREEIRSDVGMDHCQPEAQNGLGDVLFPPGKAQTSKDESAMSYTLNCRVFQDFKQAVAGSNFNL